MPKVKLTTVTRCELEQRLINLLPAEYKNAVEDLTTLLMLDVVDTYSKLPEKGERSKTQVFDRLKKWIEKKEAESGKS